MSWVLTLSIVGLGGALGALTRYGLGELARVWARLPGWTAIMIANVAGCLLLAAGFTWFGVRAHHLLPGSARLEDLELLRTMLLTGYCGSLTTFSTFSLDTVMLGYEGRWSVAAWNLLGSTVAGLAAIAFALEAGRWL